MSNEKIELYDSFSEEEKYPCYGIKILKKTKEIDVCRDKKTIKRFSQDSFPGIDFDNVGDIAKLIEIVKMGGCVGLMRAFKIQE